MKKIFLMTMSLVIISCTSDLLSVFKNNKENFSKLSKLIGENEKFFFNNDQEIPRLFLKSQFSKKYDLLKEDSKKNLSKELYVELNKLLDLLEINEFYLTNEGDLFFKVLSKDYFVRTNDFFIAHIINNKNQFKTISYYSIDGLENLGSNWFAVYGKSSIAN